ncbi:hypothetical protein ARALYDRAFT_495669 [Arabidopsis lyrata subsp. lyrata]|uniref:KIB1-4 beta-propeller domain-containing protein n=1 Tax=Arabidopsis lyrata subsp. lyrata TaxID=81972 RepID=D7ML50_ARALL|nr:hypothetical protein ARALYDRAFT_495669 [Arabidopsis lyrata subsp. lyrata]
MSLLLNQPSKLLCFRRKSVLVRSSPLLSNGLSSSLRQTPPCTIIDAVPCGADLGKLVISNANAVRYTYLEKKVPLELVDNPMLTIGSSHGWIATLSQDDGILRLQDDLNPVASDIEPKRIPLPPLVTLPHCQTQYKNIPAQRNSEWINVRIANPCFYSSRVMFSEKHDMFCIPGSGGHLIASWDLHTDKHKNPKFQRLRFQNIPKLTKTKREIMDSCYKSEHLVESRTTGETFLVKWYRKAVWRGMSKLSTKALMVFRLDDEGNAVYTIDIGDLCIFLSKSEPFCVSLSSLPGMFFPNNVEYMDADEAGYYDLADSSIVGDLTLMGTGVYIPPQNIDN